MTAQTADACRRCGTCCRGGGPALHRQDGRLVLMGRLPLADLFTIRPGEPVIDNVAGGHAFARTDIIKIKGVGDQWQCRYFDPDSHGCGIYEHRPLECRLLLCTKPAAAARQYDRDRLLRLDLLEDRDDLGALVKEHEARCGYAELSQLAKAVLDGDTTATESLSEMISYDHHLRALVAERAPAMKEIIDFLLGRPLTASMAGFGLRAEKRSATDRIILRPMLPPR